MKKAIVYFFPAILLAACGNNDEATKRFEQRQKELGSVTNAASKSSVNTCYQAIIGKDSAFFNLEENGSTVSGQLEYRRFESDHSTGTFSGSWHGDTLIGNYHFRSEGMYSDMEKAFLKKDGQLVEAVGVLKDETETKLIFADRSKLEYGKVYSFSPVPCAP